MNRLDLVRWIDLHPVVDDRGSLTAIESGQSIPFEIKRVYFLHDIVADRAGHAHRDTQQVIIRLAGNFVISLSNEFETTSYELNRSDKGLYLPPMLFIRLTKFSPDAVTLVLASTHYDKSRSIRSWAEYIEATR